MAQGFRAISIARFSSRALEKICRLHAVNSERIMGAERPQEARFGFLQNGSRLRLPFIRVYTSKCSSRMSGLDSAKR